MANVQDGQVVVEVRHPLAAEKEVSLPLHVLQRVPGERVELGRETRSGLLHRTEHRFLGLPHPHARELVTHVHPVVLDTDRPALLHLPHQERTDVVDQRNTRLDQDEGAEVRVPPGDRRAGVDHRGRPPGHQPLGGHPVEVLVVDHRHLPGTEPPEQPFGADVHPGGGRFLPGPSGAEPQHVRTSEGGA